MRMVWLLHDELEALKRHCVDAREGYAGRWFVFAWKICLSSDEQRADEYVEVDLMLDHVRCVTLVGRSDRFIRFSGNADGDIDIGCPVERPPAFLRRVKVDVNDSRRINRVASIREAFRVQVSFSEDDSIVPSFFKAAAAEKVIVKPHMLVLVRRCRKLHFETIGHVHPFHNDKTYAEVNSSRIEWITMKVDQVVLVDGMHVDRISEPCAPFGRQLALLPAAVSVALEDIVIRRQFLSTWNRPSCGLLLIDAQSTGVTPMLEAWCLHHSVRFVKVDAAAIASVSSEPGAPERMLREAFSDARSGSQSCVVLLPDVELLCPKRQGQITSTSSECRMVGQLLTLIDGVECRPDDARIVTIAITGSPSKIDPALRRSGRLDRELVVPIPDDHARRSMMQAQLETMSADAGIDLDAIVSRMNAFTASDILSLLRESLLIARRNDRPCIQQSDLISALKCIQGSILRGADANSSSLSRIGWTDIGGLDDVKQKLRQLIEWPFTRAESFKLFRLSIPRGILLHGPPGCAKTLMIRALASNVRWAFLRLDPATVYSSFVGASEAAVRRIFDQARSCAPCLLLLDEVDAIVSNRGFGSASSEDRVQERVLSTLLNEMDGIQTCADVLVVGTTNCPKRLDPALLRPGRFDYVFYVPPPDLLARLSIFRIHFRKIPLADNVDLATLASLTGGYTGSDIKAICEEAALVALRRNIDAQYVTNDDFVLAIQRAVPSVSSETLLQYEEFDRLMSKHPDMSELKV